MNIYPERNSNILLLSNVPLNNTYENTLTHKSLADQHSTFLKYVIKQFNNFSYQRPYSSNGVSNTIRVPIIADKLYNCNYLMFQNSDYGNKWFYAFVNEVRYINDSVTELVFEIDIMQTWYFQINMRTCFVEREHVNDDMKYHNLIPEDIGLGPYVYNNYQTIEELMPENCYIVVAASFGPESVTENWVKYDQGTIGNLYNGLYYYAFENKDSVNEFIKNATDAALSAGIVTIFMFPIALWPQYVEGSEIVPRLSITDKGKSSNTINGYTPKNNKLFNYPFNFCLVTNQLGSKAELRYELFEDEPIFQVTGALSGCPNFILAPVNYKSIQGANWQESLGLAGFPICSWITDTYKAYLAQNGASYVVDNAGSVVNGIMSTISGGMQIAAGLDSGSSQAVVGGVGTILGGAENIANTIAKDIDLTKLPPGSNYNCGQETGFVLNLRNFQIYNCQITKEFARIIDNYFSMYGYRVNALKIPNRLGRKSWNYVKTANANIIGDIPADDLSKICSIYNRGVTFWHNTNVGDYTQDNSIV